MSHRFDDVSRSGLAFRSEHCCTFSNAAKSLAEVSAAAHEWDFKVVFVDVVLLVGHCEHFTLVDVVDFNRFKDLCLNEVSNACLKGYDVVSLAR